MRLIIIVVLALAVILGYLFWRFSPSLFKKQPAEVKDVNLVIYGLWEEEDLIKPAIEDYQKVKPKVHIKYNFQNIDNYRTRIQTFITGNEQVDVFAIHNSWLPMFLNSNLLAPLPNEIMSNTDYSKAFYPVAIQTLSKDSKIYAMPRGIDGLALYYNEDILKAAGVDVPQTWDQFVSAAVKTTVADSKGNIQTAGAALGTTSNVDHWQDIVGLLLMQQSAGKIDTLDDQSKAEVLKFYSEFVTDPAKKVWDQTMPSSTQAFSEGKLAFYFGPSWRAQQFTSSQNLNFKTAPVPQLPGKNITWGTFWAYAVSSKSTNSTEAWEFIKFLTSAEQQKKLYQEASKVRLFGLPYSRVELQKEIASDPIVGAFVIQAPTYKSWYLSSRTFDQGINDEMSKYFEDAINSILKGSDAISVVETVDKGIDQIYKTYGISSPNPSADR
ncbi:sugar ABC transporter substrate-binding protein [Candidatus Daviesbacteria bacterium]|nr:sugar ABC transporter substrate-binding protein [Candidatus Daviesbacteria bacterium]